MTCALSACPHPARFRVEFQTGDVYHYCDKHGFRFDRSYRGTRFIARVTQVRR